MHTERFAPSPTGPLHLGHAFSALTAFERAQAAGGAFLLRIEDTDITRCRPEWEAQIYDDLRWLGVSWPEPILRQSERFPLYRETLAALWDRGLVFACSCSRRDVQAAASAPNEGMPLIGPDGIVYPGTCRGLPRTGPLPDVPVLRLDMRRAVEALGGRDLTYVETGTEPGVVTVCAEALIHQVGDVVLGRHGTGTSYHLSVVVDDAFQQISHVTRGEDLREATQSHVLLQALLDLPTPVYHHHRLIRDDTGKRLAKRDDARAIATYRADGATVDDIRQMVGLERLAK
ncbi:tRNA glutamyl-Q(34) synthetase GluQRS [Halovulum sp. GXIMD14793]